jgi:hypothetical protein
MKKILLGLLLSVLAGTVHAQTASTYYTAPTVAAVKALTTRPSVIEVVDANPGIFNWGTTPCSAADDIFQITPTSGPTGCYTRLATPLSIGKSVAPYSVPVTSSAGTPSYITRSAFTSSISVDQYYSGSGTYDAAIAAAIAAAPAIGANIMFSAGTEYFVSAPIAVTRGALRFQCSGLRSCNIQSTSTTADLFAVNLTVATTTISTTNGSPTATVASGSGITNGMQINSANVPSGTTVTISGTTVTLSANATDTASGTAATFGNYIYDVYWDGLTFSRASTSSAGCQINARNVSYTGVSNSRFYGNLATWKHVCLRSVNDFALDNVASDNPQNAHLTLEGISARGFGTLDGAFIGLTVRNYSYFTGGHAATASPLDHGSIEIGDFTGGLFFDTTVIARPRGYAVKMLGTSAGLAANLNALVFFTNANVEGSGPDGESGGIDAEYYSNINVTGGWISSTGTPTIKQGANSSGLTVTGAQLVVNGSSAPIVSAAGSSLNLTGNRLQSYNPGVGIGLTLATGADSVNVQGNHFESLATGISDGGLSNIDINIDGNQFYSTTTPIASTIYTWAKATIGTSNSDQNGLLVGNVTSAQPVTSTGSSTARTLAVRAADVTYAADFGAVCDGVTTGAAAAINNAITYRNSVGGGSVVLPTGTCLISTSILAQNKVHIFGQSIGGGDHGQCGTTLKWTGAASGKIYSSDTGSLVANHGLNAVCMDGDGIAGHALYLIASVRGLFSNVLVEKVTTSGLYLNTNPALNYGPQFNDFTNLEINLSDASAINADGVFIGTGRVGPDYNSNFNTWNNLVVNHQDGRGFACGNADSNYVYNSRFNTVGGGTGVSLALLAAASAVEGCRANTFSGIQAIGGIISYSGASAPLDNTFTGVLTESGGTTPVFQSGATGSWTDQDGNSFTTNWMSTASLFTIKTPLSVTGGAVAIGASSALANVSVDLNKTITGGTDGHGYFQQGVIQSGVTAQAWGFRNIMHTAAASFTLPASNGYAAAQGTIGSGSTVTIQNGFLAEASLIGAASNRGFASLNAAAVTAGKTHLAFYTDQNVATGGGTTFAYYAGGTAPSAFFAPVKIGGGTTVVNLPATAAGGAVAGARSYVTDQLTACVAPGAAITGGGALTCPVFYNGAAWVGG